METLARMELTSGLTCAELILESASRLPRDASVVALLRRVTGETALALGSLKRLGYAVSAIVNVYEDHEYAEFAGLLLAQGVESGASQGRKRTSRGFARRGLLR